MDISLQVLRSYAFLIAYFAMIIVGLVMPSDGNHGILTPKSLSFLGSCFFFLNYVLTKGQVSLYQLKVLSFTALLSAFLLIWLFLGLAGNLVSQEAPLDQFKIFIITFSFVVMTLYAVDEKLVSPETLIRTMIFTNFIYSIIKLSLILLHVLQIINMFDLMEALDMRFMSMEMASGFSRFQTSVDIVTPFFILFVLQSDELNLKFNSLFKYSYFVISIVAIMFSFSRFLMGVAFFSSILYMVTLNKKNLQKALLLFLGLVVVFIAVLGFDVLLTMIERRFFSHDNYYSDLTRTQQIDALMEQFFKAPYFGMGLGGFVKDFVRDGGIVYSYEVQWVAFLMQFGLFGIILLLIPVGFICSQFLLRPLSKVKFSFLGLFLIWLLSGFTNPFLISLASGIVYAIFLLAANILNRPKYIHDAEK